MNPIVRIGGTHICGNPQHPPNVIISGGLSVVGGRPVAPKGGACACGTVITQGICQLSDNDHSIADHDSKTQRGPFAGQITTGSSTMKVQS